MTRLHNTLNITIPESSQFQREKHSKRGKKRLWKKTKQNQILSPDCLKTKYLLNQTCSDLWFCYEPHSSESVFDLWRHEDQDLSDVLLPVENVFGFSAPQLTVPRLRVLTALLHLLLLLLRDRTTPEWGDEIHQAGHSSKHLLLSFMK